MTSRQLPERPNLEQLKKQAKTLLHAAQAKDPSALARFRILPAFTRYAVESPDTNTIALHDAQSVIAREHGFDSWKALREHVEERSMSFAAAVNEFVRCATGGAPGRAGRLLALYPGIARANLQTALVLGDVADVRARLQSQPDAATQAGGIQHWEPLCYVCHTCMHVEAPARIAGLVAIARELLARGANPNATYTFRWHAELPRTVLWAALCAVRHLQLAEVLLEAGANPTDGVSAHITAGGGDVAPLELLHRYGMDVNGVAGGVPPLMHILGWSTNPTGPRWLLEHGADPNLSCGGAGEAPLHVAARRWDLPMVELLVQHGADVSPRRRDGRTPHTVAELHGKREVAAWLRAHGANDELTSLERFIAMCARADRAAADAALQREPQLRGELRREHHLMLHEPAERGDAIVLETMLACGFDPHVKDSEGITALHRAAMAGHPEAVRVLLKHGAPVNALDHTFCATPLVWAVEGWSHASNGDGSEHPAVARLLIDAGSSVDWDAPERAPGPERTQEGLLELRRAAAGVGAHL